MTAIGALLAVLVVLRLEGVEVRYAAPDEPELVTDGGTAAASPGGGPRGPGGPDPWSIVDAIKRAHRGVDVSAGLLPSLILPGFGGRTRTKCGDFRPSFCTDCGGPSPGKDTCDQSTCQHCAPNWARRRATEVCRKLEAGRAMLWAPSRKTKHHHLTISPAPRGEAWRFEGDDPLQRAFETVRDIMDELGIQGYVIYHPYRAPGEPDDPYDHLGFWKDIVFQNREWDDVRDELEWSPHFHVICVSEFVQGEGVTDVVHEETGWVIHRITEGESNRSVGDNLDLARVVTYCLSHAGLYETSDGRMRVATRWYGADIRGADKKEKYRMEWERIVRTVSTRTLGLEKKDLLCGREALGTLQTSMGSFGGAQARMGSDTDASSGDEDVDDFAEGRHVDATGEVTIGSSGPVAAETSMPDTPDSSTTLEGQGEPCEGPLYDISRAPEFLSDDEWVEQAAYSKQLEKEYERWQVTEDFMQHVDEDLDLIQQGRGDEARIDWPPPD